MNRREEAQMTSEEEAEVDSGEKTAEVAADSEMKKEVATMETGETMRLLVVVADSEDRLVLEEEAEIEVALGGVKVAIREEITLITEEKVEAAPTEEVEVKTIEEDETTFLN